MLSRREINGSPYSREVSENETQWTLVFDDFDSDLVAQRRGGRSIGVIIPAQNEADSVGLVLDAVRSGALAVDDLVMVDDHSHDDTATVARRHGARVVRHEGPAGKGEAMATGLAATTTDVVVFLDADVLNTQPDFVARLVQPLLASDDVQLVKGYYVRPLYDMPTGGGRVTELAARPILSLLYPGLGEIRQPLAGETAARLVQALEAQFPEQEFVEIRHPRVESEDDLQLAVSRMRGRPAVVVYTLVKPELRDAIRNIEISVEDEHPDDPDLFGLYEGVPLPERGDWAGALPDRIRIFRLPLVDSFPDPTELEEEIRITVLHELAHYFGIDEDRLDELGYA